MAYQDVIMADAPIAYWRMDEATGPYAYDATANGNYGTYTAGYVVNQGPGIGGAGAAVWFNGVNGYVSVPDIAAYGSSALTLECWCFPTGSLGSGSFINRRHPNNTGGFTLEANPGGTQMFVNIAGVWNAVSGPPLAVYVWHHIVGVYTSGRLEVWVDGRLGAQSLAVTGAINNPAGAVVELGRNIGNTAVCFNGLLDEVAIYNTALSGNRIRAHHRAAQITYAPNLYAIMTDNPVGYWKLDELSGTVATDTSGRGNTGTYTGTVGQGQPGAILTDPANKAANFSPAQGGFVSMPQAASINTPAGWSVEGWAYVRSYPATGLAPCIFTSNYPAVDSSGNIPVVIGFDYAGANNGKMFAGYHNGGFGWTQCVQNGLFPLNKWTHVAGVFTGSVLSLYIDGVLNATIPTTIVNALPSSAARYIGRRWDQPDILDGLIDEVVLYDKPLTAQRIAAHYLAGVSTYANEIMFDLPRGYWRVQEASLSTVIDSSGGGLHGTYRGATGHTYAQPSRLPGSVAHGMTNASLSASGPWIDLGYGAVYTGLTAFTVEAWCNTASGVDGATIIGSHNNGYGGFGLVINGPGGNPYRMHLRVADSQFIEDASKYFTGNTWHHFAATYDGATYRVYVDGLLYASAAKTTEPGGSGSGNPFMLGGGAPGWGGPAGYGGLIDEGAFYTVALPADRILMHYLAGRDPLVKRFDGSAWQPPQTQRFDGSAWQPATVRRWDGSSWV